MKRSIQTTLTGEAFKAKPVCGSSSVGSGNQSLYCEGSKSRGEIYTKHHSHSSPAGAESDSNPTAAAHSQTEITDLNRSDHSTTSKKRNGRVASFSAHPSDTDSGSDSTIHYGVTAIVQPTSIATRKNKERRREESRKTEVVEWSERLRSVISVWLGAAAVGFESDSAPASVE